MASPASPQSPLLSPIADADILRHPQSSQLSLSSSTTVYHFLLEFTCFPRLPAEMRCEIWKLSMLPRNVDIYVHHVGFVKSGHFKIAELYSKKPVPAILHVSQESRTVGLMTYCLCFGTSHARKSEDRKNLFIFLRSPSTYFSYQMDTARFKYTEDTTTQRRNIPTTYMNDSDLRNIRHIRVDWRVHVDASLIMSMASFKALETFTISWFGQEKVEDEVDNTETLDKEDDELFGLLIRPDIHQFIDFMKLMRDIFAPGYQFPLLVIKSLSNKHILRDTLMTIMMNLALTQ